MVRRTKIVCEEKPTRNDDSDLSAAVRNQFTKASYGLRANFFRPEREPERVHFLPTSHRLVIWTMGGLNHRSFDLVWSDECLGGRGKDCTSQSLNCKLLFVQITAHSRLHTKSLKSTELGGPRGTRRSFLGTLHARRVLQNENSACCFREHLEGSVLGKNGAWGVCFGTQTKKPRR